MAEPDPAPAPPATSPGAAALAVLVVLAVLGVVLLATWAAGSGPGPVLGGGDRPDFAPPASAPPRTSAGAADAGAADVRPETEATAGRAPGWLAVLLQGAGLLVVAAAAWLVARRALRAWTARSPASSRESTPDDRAGRPVPSLGRVRASITEAAGEQRALLLEGSPRNGVVACWQRFEDLADGASLPRQPSETTAEFARRLLEVAEADPAAVERLAARYREARFSAHPVTEEHRAEALAAFDALGASLNRDVS